jgi:NADPH:quinone reductase-like Zn-dependent oxidoreductase
VPPAASASEANHQWLASHGVVAVSYGQGAADRIRAASGGRVDAFLDTFGNGYVELALELGVRPERIDTITDFEAAAKYGVKTDGNAAGGNAQVLAELADLVDRGLLEITIANVYALDQVQDAFRELEHGHTRGKIVLRP